MEIKNLSLNENINDILNDSCLINIFEYLPLDDKLRIESVSKRWQKLGKLSWSKTKIFKIEENAKEEWSDTLNFIINVIKRCGSYLNSLTIELYHAMDFPLIFQEILNNCQNIKNFKFENYNTGINYDMYFGQLFKKNKKISSVSLSLLQLNGDCLSNLCADSIVELFLDCDFDSEHYLYNFLSKLKISEVIDLNLSNNNKNMIIHALANNDCENIQKFRMHNSQEVCPLRLSNWLSKQKKLSKLLFKDYFYINGNFFDNLKDCPIQELNIGEITEKWSAKLSSFKSLTVLTCCVQYLTDKVVKNISNCSNLKVLDLTVKAALVTANGENSFADFSNIESLRFDSQCKLNIGKILSAIAKNSKNLKVLDLDYCEIKDSELKSIYLHENLSELKLSLSDIENVENLIDLISSLSNLREICLSFNDNTRELDYEFFKLINDAKFNRGDKNVLEIYLNHENYDFFNKEFSLLSVKKI